MTTRYKDQVENVNFFVVDTEVESVLSGNSCLKLGLLKRVHELTGQASGALGLSRIVHGMRMFARYASHRANRRRCACSPCPKEGTRATESKNC